VQSRAALEVLIVEDSEPDAQLIVLELRRRGFRPRWERVESEAALKAALLERRWDVLISDSSLPSLGVMQALAMARELAPALPFIVVSGSITEEVAVRALRGGAADCVVKDRLERLAPAVVRELALARVSAQEGDVRGPRGGTKDLLRPILSGLKRSIERARKERGPSQSRALAEAASLVEQAILQTRAPLPGELGPAGPREDVPMAALTPRQVQILQLIAEGQSTKQIAARLEISAKTVESHRAQIMQRLDVHHVAGLVHYALRRGIVRRDV
jgi:DNA-binding NarL/FixJ family response regulator